MKNAESLLEAVVASAGIAMAINFVASEAIRKGKLKRLLTKYVARGPDVFLLHLAGRSMPAKLRVFIDFLMDVA